MKKILVFLLILALSFTCMACVATQKEPVDENPQGLQFYIQDDGTYIVACGDAKYLSNIVIPATYKGGAVVGIDYTGFCYCFKLTSITIPDTVTSIDYNAFGSCTSLTSINFEGTVDQWNDIEKHTFWILPSVPVKNVICSDGIVPLTQN